MVLITYFAIHLSNVDTRIDTHEVIQDEKELKELPGTVLQESHYQFCAQYLQDLSKYKMYFVIENARHIATDNDVDVQIQIVAHH